ncbi:crossover junction endodeoxyribonuclease RuvC [Rubinisphaera italica]|uniref:Crossover junction endodeoxyribonuclease RuvC n=1 Tax=Rubinisphaera italica TaxID=2527969 RepID=A0A5C5XHX4_9PLAN|nr:crossover junction endodeoxyribonuclease RuvC [Rubinisphaera italica]TWT62707.1 Crossover junction endodeoxyribonuclease RuvC [Rubinisphaera italica]
MERILGIDPGLNRTGYGVIHREQNRVILDEGGVVATNPSQPLAERICEIACEIREVIDQWKPTALAIEQVFSLGKNPKSAILLAHVRGAVLANAFESGLKIYHYKPTQIKKLLTGHGRASKEQMQHVVKTELGLSEVPRPHDVADALAIALCHLHTSIPDQYAA